MNSLSNYDLLSKLQNELTSQEEKQKIRLVLLEKCCEILPIAPSKRSEVQIQILLETFKENEFLLKSKKDKESFMQNLRLCISSLSFRKINKGNAAFHFGQLGSEFFIVLKGNASIFLPKKYEEYTNDFQNIKQKMMNIISNAKLPIIENDIDLFLELKSKNLEEISLEQFAQNFEKLIQTQEDPVEKIESNLMEQQKQSKIRQIYIQVLQDLFPLEQMIKVNQQNRNLYFKQDYCKFRPLAFEKGPGQYFGGKYNLNQQQYFYYEELALIHNKPRSALVIAKSELSLAVLNKSDFVQIFDDQTKELQFKTRFFIKLFPYLSKETVIKFCYEFKIQKCTNKGILFNQGEKAHTFFIVKCGQVDLFIEEKQFSQDLNNAQIKTSEQQNLEKFKIKFLQKKKFVKVSQIPMGQFLCDYEIMNELPIFFTGIAAERTELYYLPAEHIIQMKKSNKYMWNNIYQMSKEKFQHRINQHSFFIYLMQNLQDQMQKDEYEKLISKLQLQEKEQKCQPHDIRTIAETELRKLQAQKKIQERQLRIKQMIERKLKRREVNFKNRGFQTLKQINQIMHAQNKQQQQRPLTQDQNNQYMRKQRDKDIFIISQYQQEEMDQEQIQNIIEKNKKFMEQKQIVNSICNSIVDFMSDKKQTQNYKIAVKSALSVKQKKNQVENIQRQKLIDSINKPKIINNKIAMMNYIPINRYKQDEQENNQVILQQLNRFSSSVNKILKPNHILSTITPLSLNSPQHQDLNFLYINSPSQTETMQFFSQTSKHCSSSSKSKSLWNFVDINKNQGIKKAIYTKKRQQSFSQTQWQNKESKHNFQRVFNIISPNSIQRSHSLRNDNNS